MAEAYNKALLVRSWRLGNATQGHLAGCATSMALVVGDKMGLIKALCKVSSAERHATPQDVAKEANCKPRYVREWLCILACADVINVEEEETFWVTDEQKSVLLSSPWISVMRFMPLFSDVRLEYSDFADFYSLISKIQAANVERTLVPNILPDIGHGVAERLAAGGMKCLDVGCGNGFHVQLMARHFPKSTFVGLDLGADAIKAAHERIENDKTTNTVSLWGKAHTSQSFIVCNAQKMPNDWTETFDFVTIFDACHDQTRPDLCLKEIHRVLKPGGVFAMVEVRGTSSVAKDKEVDPQRSAVHYACSFFHCLPVGSNSEDALCLGTMWGKERALDLMKYCGFENPEFVNPKYLAVNTIYVAKKEVNPW